MTPELDEALVRDFPQLYADRYADMRQTCMCWGFTCGDGWEPLIRRLSARLEGSGVIADQVKQKFGALRFYRHGKGTSPSLGRRLWRLLRDWLGLGYWKPCAPWWNLRARWRFTDSDVENDWIDAACAESARTCEECGAHGKLRTKRSWLETLCDSCEAKRCGAQ